MKRLNPHSAIIKKYAKITNEQRRKAREVLRRKRQGDKVDEKEVKKAASTLGLKLRKYKEYKAEIQKKKTALKEARQKVKDAKEKKKEKTASKDAKSKPSAKKPEKK